MTPSTSSKTTCAAVETTQAAEGSRNIISLEKRSVGLVLSSQKEGTGMACVCDFPALIVLGLTCQSFCMLKQ